MMVSIDSPKRQPGLVHFSASSTDPLYSTTVSFGIRREARLWGFSELEYDGFWRSFGLGPFLLVSWYDRGDYGTKVKVRIERS